MSKKAVVSVFFIVLLCFSAGWFVGQRNSNKTMRPALIEAQLESSGAISIDQIINQSTVDMTVIGLLNRSRTDDANQLLLIRQDGNILAINELLINSSENSTRRATNLLHSIAKYRNENPFNYTGHLAQLDTNTLVKVAEILKRYK